MSNLVGCCAQTENNLASQIPQASERPSGMLCCRGKVTLHSRFTLTRDQCQQTPQILPDYNQFRQSTNKALHDCCASLHQYRELSCKAAGKFPDYKWVIKYKIAWRSTNFNRSIQGNIQGTWCACTCHGKNEFCLRLTLELGQHLCMCGGWSHVYTQHGENFLPPFAAVQSTSTTKQPKLKVRTTRVRNRYRAERKNIMLQAQHVKDGSCLWGPSMHSDILPHWTTSSSPVQLRAYPSWHHMPQHLGCRHPQSTVWIQYHSESVYELMTAQVISERPGRQHPARRAR